MFNRTKGAAESTETTPLETVTQSPVAQRAVMPETVMRTVTPVSHAPARRPPQQDLSHNNSRRDRGNSAETAGARKLIVGQGLSVNGEITACDVLVVEGKVEAKLSDGKLLEIAESGQFRGAVEIENADIAGRYDGQLTVHGRLTVRGTGRISGMVKYGELEVNAGGQIIGELQVEGSSAQAAATSTGGHSFKSAAKFTAQTDDEEDNLITRKASNG